MSDRRGANIDDADPKSWRLARGERIHERISGIQCARLLAAMTDVVSERGLEDATVARVVARAGVSRRTFYELFDGREECFIAALDSVITQVTRSVTKACDLSASWDVRVRTGLVALLSFLDVEREAGRLLIVGLFGMGPKALERRKRVLAQAITVVDQGRSEVKGDSQPPLLTAEGLVGGALSIIHARLLESRRGPLVELVGPLMSMMVLPYLGSAAACREIERPVLKLRMSGGHSDGDPLRNVGMRLTYRTVRVLMSIAAESGASNREIGIASGVSDQGQISKLLARLQQRGLVRNAGLPGKGAANAWVLTEKGVQVERAMSADVSSRS
jgi:AcrR family transcriptional regulator/DNA-binding MarR family transcriptional regulator